jgi:hypothetical protein
MYRVTTARKVGSSSKVWPWMTSDFIEWKNDSMKALSPISRGRFMLWGDPEGSQAGTEVISRIFYAAVRVKDQARPTATPLPSAIESIQRQCHVSLHAQTPAQHPPRMPIQDHRQIPPPTATLQIRHITDQT